MQKILFLGDSITDANRNWNPHTKGLGEGYVHIISSVLDNSTIPYQIVNKGHDGFTLPSVLRTLEEDCMLQEPDPRNITCGYLKFYMHRLAFKKSLLQIIFRSYRCMND